MEIKLECPCGQPFEFEAEPENNQMPCAIQCPACNADATELANRYIAENLPAPPSPVAAPAPIGLRINREVHAAPPAATAAPLTSAPEKISAPPKAPKPESSGDGFVKGALSALVGAVVGMLVWFFLIKATGYQIGWVAWGVGALTGFAARVVGAEGSVKLGVVAGALALLAIVGGQYLALRSLMMTEFDKLAVVAYQVQVDYAKQVAAAGSEADMKAIYAKENDEKISEVKSQDWDEFQQKELPKLKELAGGKPTEKEFVRNFRKEVGSFSSEFEMLKDSVGLFTLLWIFLGVGSAFKLASGGND